MAALTAVVSFRTTDRASATASSSRALTTEHVTAALGITSARTRTSASVLPASSVRAESSWPLRARVPHSSLNHPALHLHLPVEHAMAHESMPLSHRPRPSSAALPPHCLTGTAVSGTTGAKVRSTVGIAVGESVRRSPTSLPCSSCLASSDTLEGSRYMANRSSEGSVAVLAVGLAQYSWIL